MDSFGQPLSPNLPPQEKPYVEPPVVNPQAPLTSPLPQPTPPPAPQPPPPTDEDPGFSQETVSPLTWRALAKLFFIIILGGSLAGGAWFATKNIFAKQKSITDSEVLVSVPYQPVLWKDFGEVFEPLIEIPLYYPSSGFVKREFLLDSGALVSSLPREEAEKMGLSLAKLQRSTFAGFGGTTSFAYKSEVKVRLGEQEVAIPVVFTEAQATKSILGRSGFFERYSIYFNSDSKRIEIRK